jgi:perosamine synthetase
MKIVQHVLGSRFDIREEIEAVSRVMKSGHVSGLTTDGEGDAFAAEFAAYCGVPYALPLNGACNALSIAAHLIGLQPGDEIISNPITYIATAIYALRHGATVRFAETDPDTLNVDEDAIEPLVTGKTKALFISSYEGHVPDLDRIADIARRHNLIFVLDAARCAGGQYKGRSIARIPHLTAWSFQEQKNMTTCDGGMLTLSDRAPDEWKVKAKQLQNVRGTGEIIGENFRMDEMRAAIGRVQLKRLDAQDDERIALARRLTAGLRPYKGIYPVREFPERRHVFHWYMARLDTDELGIRRDAFTRLMEEEGVQMPGHNQPAYLEPVFAMRGYKPGLCPLSEKLWREQNIRLPFNLGMTDLEIDYMVDAVGRTLKRLSAR